MTTSQAVAPLGAAEFKQLMRGVASGVTVITTLHDGKPHGMTATAFSSVSADPPTVLIVLNKDTRTHPLISASQHFVVNMLREDQADLGNRFSKKLDDQFADLDYHDGQLGAPVLEGTVSHIECRAVQQFDVGTHTIFIGEVIDGASSQQSPLLYHGGMYKALMTP